MASDPPTEVEVVAEEDDTVMEAAVAAGVGGIVAQCGGSGICGTCHVYVNEEFLSIIPDPGPNEFDTLAGVAAQRRPNSRLSCQLILDDPALDGLRLTIPDRQL